MVEFDAYAPDYDAGMDNPLKRRLGDSAADFIAPKVSLLLEDLERAGLAAKTDRGGSLDVLDYGCGAGLFLRHLQRRGFRGRLRGCDVSAAMLAQARKTWTEGAIPPLDVIGAHGLPYPDQCFDVVILCAMLHHVAPAEREAVARAAQRVLRPRGRLYVFEHNPFNPVTVWVVRHTPIDVGAILLSSGAARALLRKAGLTPVRTDYLMFFPPRWRQARPIEKRVRWLPLGGQYVVVAAKSTVNSCCK